MVVLARLDLTVLVGNHNVYTPIASATAGVVITGDRISFAVTFHFDPIACNTVIQQFIDDCLGTLFGKLLVVLFGAGAIGITLNPNSAIFILIQVSGRKNVQRYLFMK